MSTFFTSDHHFGHAGALGLYRRPFASVAEINRQMIDRWNSAVRPDDEVWHLGDFAIRQRPERVASLLKALHGRKHLITGNNDDAAVNACDGWGSVQPYAEVSVDGMHLVLCHYPFWTWRNMGKGWANLHGHSHGRLKRLPRQFDVGVEVWNFRPVQLAEVLGSMKAGMRGPAWMPPFAKGPRLSPCVTSMQKLRCIKLLGRGQCSRGDLRLGSSSQSASSLALDFGGAPMRRPFHASCRFIPSAPPASRPRLTFPQSSIVNWFVAMFAELKLEGCSSHSGRRTFITAAAKNVHRAGGKPARRTRTAAAFVGPGGRARVLRDAFVTADRYPGGTVLCVQYKEMKQAWCLAASSTSATSRALMRTYGVSGRVSSTIAAGRNPTELPHDPC